MKALPGGGFDRNYWWMLREPPIQDWGDWGLVDETLAPRPSFYAFKQTAEQLSGKRCNGRVMLGGTKDDSVRVYEFEDPVSLKKTWVCWQNVPNTAPPPTVITRLPARSDTTSATDLDYGDDPPLTEKPAAATGWLPCTLTTRPAFITEPGNRQIRRPDLVVDSFRVMPERPQIGKEMGFVAYVRNTDTTRATPDTVWYRFLCDTTTVCSVPGPSIGPLGRDTVTVIGCVVQNWMRGEHLFRLEVNPGQKFVEKVGMDDNDGYSRNRVVWPPIGEIGVVCGSHSNEPPALFSLETHSIESDTLGSVPAESARLVQLWYANDTAVQGGDTTAWFRASAATTLDTSWLYLSGQGKYKLFLQVKDSWSESDLIPDTVHPYVIFDTTGPTGSIVLNSGARFATSSTCTLALAASDSTSGVCDMRLMNVPEADLVRNGSFVVVDATWQLTQAEIDEDLHMGKLTVGPTEASVRQFIPAESISAHDGDSCVLQASVMAHVHEDDAVGEVSYWFYSIRQDSLNLHDTLWQLVDSVSYSGDLLSLTGRYGLSKHFLLTEPAPESGWVWKGGMVKVRAHAENGVGSVYTDNVGLIPFEPLSSYSRSYDTLAEWDIGSGAGEHVVSVAYLDSAGNQNATPCADTIILDATPPVVHITLPSLGLMVNGTVDITGWAYDSVEVPGDSWFSARRLFYRQVDSTDWLPVIPDSVSSEQAWPDSQSAQGPAVHLGYWNTAPILNGQYYLKLTAADSAGHVSSCSTWVMVFHGGEGGGFCEGPVGGGTGLGEGSLYVGSSAGTVLHLSNALDSLDAFSVSDSGSQACITGIIEVGDDSLLILDALNGRIHKLHRNGQNRRRLVSNLSQPSGITKDENANFWLVDKGIHRIGKFRQDGTLVFVRGGLGTDSLHFHSPEGIAVKGDLVYVADGGNSRIAVWDTSGNFKTTIAGDFARPTAVIVTDEGAIYLTDDNDGKLKGITPFGGNIVAVATEDSSKLKGLVASEDGYSLFSLAPEPNRVYKLAIRSDDSAPGGVQSGGKVNLPEVLSLAQPFPNPARTRLNIAYALPHQTRVVLKLYDVAGKLVSSIVNGEQKPGYYNLTWNRQDTKGRSCAGGVYFCTMGADDKRFSRKVILTE